MNITDIKIRRAYEANETNRLRALVSITLDGELAIHDIKVIEGPGRLFIAMPSRRDGNGVFRDISHPISQAARDYLEGAVLDKYKWFLAAQEIEQTDIVTDDGEP